MLKRIISFVLCVAISISFSLTSYAENDDRGPEAGDHVFLGHYEQDNDLKNGPEPIEWRILEVKGDKILLLSEYILDAQPFNEEIASNQWGSSSLRQWLNTVFLKTAFTEEELNAIQLTKVDNSAKQTHYLTSGESNTEDHIFLLSDDEVINYFSSPNLVYCMATEFAKPKIESVHISTSFNGFTSKGTFTETETYENEKYAPWWLRSPSLSWDQAVGAYYKDTISTHNWYKKALHGWYYDYRSSIGIRPAMWVYLSFLPSKSVSSTNNSTDNSSLIWGQEYTQGELTYSFVQQGALSYFSLRGKDADTLVNAVSINAIPNTERINAKIQEIMEARNYEPTAGEIDGTPAELYGSEDSDAFIMATYGDWGVNMMLFVDGATGIADYYSGTIQAESKSSLGSAMQNNQQKEKTVKQFDLTAKEYIDAFNKKYSSLGMTLIADQSKDDCWLSIRGERTDIRIQFCDKINGPWTTGSGLDMKEWNWLYAYIATDDYSIDIEYFAKFPTLCSFFAAVVDCDYTQEEFLDHCVVSGPNDYPIMTYTKGGVQNQIQFRDASVGNYHQTVYSASFELVQ